MKKKKVLLIILLIGLIIILPGSIYYKIQLYKLTYIHTFFRTDENYITEFQRKTDIKKYDLSFDLYPEKKMFKAVAILYGEVNDSTIDRIDLNLSDNFEINKVLLNDISVEYENEGTRFSVPFNSFDGRNFKIEIEYEGTPEKAGLDGFVFGNRDGNSLVYNLSEPTFASTWFPCNDFPTDKSVLDIRITNDSNMVSVSNGVLVEVNTNGNRKTYHWRTEYPISTYLIAIYSADYDHFSDHYISLDGNDTMKVEYYVLPDKLEKAKSDFSDQIKILKYLSQTFGEYPFIKEKYGIAEFLWQLGAMEHQTITGVSSYLIGGKKYFEDVLIHELAHQWWGNAVGLKNWNDIWLNEGFSTYSEALYYENESGKKALQSTMISKMSHSFSGTLAEPGQFLFTNTVYNKGAWVLHMLRREVGDSSFFKILRTYYETFKYSNASTSDFKNICEKISGYNLNKFFDQWINGEGEIELEYTSSIKKYDNHIKIELGIKQVQEDYEVYHFPLDIQLMYEDSTTKNFSFNISTKDTLLEIVTEKDILNIDLDPDSWLLATIKAEEE